MKRRSQNTIISYMSDVKAYLKWLEDNGKDRPLEKGIKDYLSHLSLERKLSASTINRNVASLNSYFDYLVYSEKIQNNPMPRIKTQVGQFKGEVKKDVEFVKPEELRKLMDGIHGVNAERNTAILASMALGGLRVSEVSNLNLGDIKEHNGRLFLDFVGKGSKRRAVPMSDAFSKIMKKYLDVRPKVDHDALFISSKGKKRLGVRAIQAMVESLGESIGMDLHCHALRHTALTYLYDATKNLPVVQEIAGHSNVNTTRIYVHLLDGATADAAESSVLNNVFA